MNRLPTPGGDNGNWGQILNDYLSVEHNPDGSLKVRSEGLPATIADGSITASKLSSSLNSMVANAQTAVQSVNGKTGQSVTLAAADISDVVADAEKGAAGGVATLDGTSKLTTSQLPSSVASKSETRKALAANLDAIVTGSVTRDSNGAATSAGVVWPDGGTGTYTATTVSTAFPGAVDAYTVTYIPPGGGTTVTYTQPAVTRDSTGAVTDRPAITVS